MLVVAVSVEYCVGHSQLALSVSDTVQAASRLVTAARRGLGGAAAPRPATGGIVAGRGGRCARRGGDSPRGEQAWHGERGQGEPRLPATAMKNTLETHVSPRRTR